MAIMQAEAGRLSANLLLLYTSYVRPSGSKIVLVGPSYPSRVLRGSKAAGWGWGGCGRGCPPVPREVGKIEHTYCLGGHRKQSIWPG